MGLFLRQSYKQKPQAYGPPSEVQASIFKNAEMAGIDPGSIALCMPMWGPGTFQDYSKNLFKPTISGAEFTKNSFYMDGTDDKFYFADNALWTPSNSLTVFVAGELVTMPPYGNEGIIAHYVGEGASGTPEDQRAWGLSVQTNGNIRSNLSSNGILQAANNISTTLPLSAGDEFKAALVWNASARNNLYLNNNKYSNATSPASLFNATSNLMLGNQYYHVNNGYYAATALNAYFKFVLLLNNFAATDSQIAYISDNPYFLLQRQPLVFYSVPSGGGLSPIKFNIDEITKGCGPLTSSQLGGLLIGG